MATMFAASGCLVAEPPEYQPPAQTPPLLDLFLADPPVTHVLAKPLDATIDFNVPVRSEDAGDMLFGAVYVDWGFSTEQWQKNVKEDPSTFDDDTRYIDFPWTVTGVTKGCHQLTLLVCHFATFDPIAQRPTDSNDQAIATWWLNVEPDETDPNSLDSCPTVSAPEMEMP